MLKPDQDQGCMNGCKIREGESAREAEGEKGKGRGVRPEKRHDRGRERHVFKIS